MGLEKAIEHGKEHRKPHHGSKRFDYSCRNHGSCAWCESNRKYNDQKRRSACDDQLSDLELNEMSEKSFKINREELYKLYMSRVEKVAEDLEWKTHFGPQEIVDMIACILETNTNLIEN